MSISVNTATNKYYVTDMQHKLCMPSLLLSFVSIHGKRIIR